MNTATNSEEIRCSGMRAGAEMFVRALIAGQLDGATRIENVDLSGGGEVRVYAGNCPRPIHRFRVGNRAYFSGGVEAAINRAMYWFFRAGRNKHKYEIVSEIADCLEKTRIPYTVIARALRESANSEITISDTPVREKSEKNEKFAIAKELKEAVDGLTIETAEQIYC